MGSFEISFGGHDPADPPGYGPKNIPHVGLATPRALAGIGVYKSRKSLVMGLSLLGNCYLVNKFLKQPLIYPELDSTDNQMFVFGNDINSNDVICAQ